MRKILGNQPPFVDIDFVTCNNFRATSMQEIPCKNFNPAYS